MDMAATVKYLPSHEAPSIHTLRVQNPGFAPHPVFWTSKDLSIAKCNFKETKDNVGNQVSLGAHNDLRTVLAKNLATHIASTEFEFIKAFKSVDAAHQLVREGSPLVGVKGGSPAFYFARRHIHQTETRLYLINKDVPGDRVPLIGYYLYNVDMLRRKRLKPRPGPNGHYNEPVQRKSDIRLRRMTPNDWRQDPYMVCLLISMGHLQWALTTGDSSLAHLLVTNLTDTTHAYIYKANIPPALFKCLDDPTRSMGDFDFPTIHYTKVSFEPYETFSDRILHHLVGAEFLSDFGSGAAGAA
ncbi:hypothetical protein F53441_4969 [Fusarium austroafricanum]|uniref:Uncharacterized protein n=1 Tax=Fusarium austroafricanum TaxID=2364996 RepID=A0A8H4P8T2_9HYPO|nr:hypothetical protein F53441_4969 [Fusarium austroafricanum]